MAHTEAEIRRAIKPLLTVYGKLNTSEVKKLLETVLTFDEDDKTASKTRKGEILITQRIGNIIAHQKELLKVYDEGFILDKKKSPAVFYLLNPISNKVFEHTEIEKIKNKRNRFIARKFDWNKLRDRNNEIGDQGEEFVLEFEIARLVEESLINKFMALQSVQHLSRLQGDGLGYDISSINNDGSIRYIEVKTTSGGIEQPFYMSKNEKNFFEVYENSAFIYRVYNFNKETRRGNVKIISKNELFSNFNFDTITWLVTPK